jgi:co-chaperonin GroES (HSP10)|tara:strand:- start:7556 stop:8134 length:579 start_codon:yes stop_codon:yes gene_type:complete
MRPVKDYFFVKVEKTQEDTIILNGRELFLDTSYDELRHARQYGTVIALPVSLPKGLSLDIKEGDKVYCHHFLTSEENEVKFHEQDKVFSVHWSHIYATVRDDKIRMIHHWNFVRQKIEDESNYITDSGIYIKPEAEDIELHGYIEHMNEEMKNMGVKKGDEVVFSKNSEYDMVIEGEKLLRMRNFDILAKVE